jgi:hypothetical protein
MERKREKGKEKETRGKRARKGLVSKWKMRSALWKENVKRRKNKRKAKKMVGEERIK